MPFRWLAGLMGLAMVFGAWSSKLNAAETVVVKTNRFDRWVTNVIEVRMPLNRFVDEYHTNWVEQVRQRVFEEYCTNWVTKVVTNRVWVQSTLTNLVHAYQTNVKTLQLTNWNTVLVIKTNWVTQYVTNTVELDLPKKDLSVPANRTVAAPPAQRPVETVDKSPLPAAKATDALALEAARGDGGGRDNHVDVKLSVRWTAGTASPVQVKRWRVERDDGSILVFGQDAEFRRDLPVGKYKVEVRAQQGGSGPLLAALGTLAVMPDEVSIEQKPARGR
jgi:hypothetical protein